MTGCMELKQRLVINFENGDIIGKVDDVFYCPGERRILGIRIIKRSLLNKRIVVLRQNIVSYSDEFILVDGYRKNKGYYKKAITFDSIHLKGIYSPSGFLVGLIKECYFDIGSFKIGEILISQGLYDELRGNLITIKKPELLHLLSGKLILEDAPEL